jgi:2'-5' RNA ligase
MFSKGYTLWLVPTGNAYDKFSNLIKSLAKKYDAPIFEPHVTLLGDIEISEEEAVKKTEQLVANQKSFPLNLGSVDYQDFHFRTLFVRAEPTKFLQNLHKRAKQIFQMDIPPYMPHLSILYGTYPEELKKGIISEIGSTKEASWIVDKVTLIKGGEVSEWKTIKEFPLIALSKSSMISFNPSCNH